MEKSITYIGLDVHKNTIAVAVAELGLGRRCVITERSRTRRALKKLIAKLASTGHELRFCYEAGLAATVSNADRRGGHECIVVALRYSKKAWRPG